MRFEPAEQLRVFSALVYAHSTNKHVKKSLVYVTEFSYVNCSLSQLIGINWIKATTPPPVQERM